MADHRPVPLLRAPRRRLPRRATTRWRRPRQLAGRDLGQDFAGRDGWRMYHGLVVPGFPQHPHRGFETVTFVRRGLRRPQPTRSGATARFGRGDVQWLTAGRGIVHCEMFPLVERDRPNPLELFQIWLNLPAADKMVDPALHDAVGRGHPRGSRSTDARSVHGDGHGRSPASSTARPRRRRHPTRGPPSREADVAIWHDAARPRRDVDDAAGAPGAETVRVALRVRRRAAHASAATSRRRPHRGDARAADAGSARRQRRRGRALLVLQGRPIGEPVAQHGPFVMNTRAEIEQAFARLPRDRASAAGRGPTTLPPTAPTVAVSRSWPTAR